MKRFPSVLDLKRIALPVYALAPRHTNVQLKETCWTASKDLYGKLPEQAEGWVHDAEALVTTTYVVTPESGMYHAPADEASDC